MDTHELWNVRTLEIAISAHISSAPLGTMEVSLALALSRSLSAAPSKWSAAHPPHRLLQNREVPPPPSSSLNPYPVLNTLSLSLQVKRPDRHNPMKPAAERSGVNHTMSSLPPPPQRPPLCAGGPWCMPRHGDRMAPGWLQMSAHPQSHRPQHQMCACPIIKA